MTAAPTPKNQAQPHMEAGPGMLLSYAATRATRALDSANLRHVFVLVAFNQDTDDFHE